MNNENANKEQALKVKAIGSYILVRPIEEEVKNSGILITGDENRSIRYKKGVIEKAGNEVTTVNEGQLIYFDKSAGSQIIINDSYFLVIRERDVVVSFSQS